jgi:hypothetical protein
VPTYFVVSRSLNERHIRSSIPCLTTYTRSNLWRHNSEVYLSKYFLKRIEPIIAVCVSRSPKLHPLSYSEVYQWHTCSIARIRGTWVTTSVLGKGTVFLSVITISCTSLSYAFQECTTINTLSRLAFLVSVLQPNIRLLFTALPAIHTTMVIFAVLSFTQAS